MRQPANTLINAVVNWAQDRPDILGIALVGSHARGEARIDSDIDLVLLASDPQQYIDQPAWVEAFGEIASINTEDWGLVTSLRVFYQDGAEVEFGMTTTEWASEPIDEGTRGVMENGMQVLLDKLGLLANAKQQTSGAGSGQQALS